MEGGGGPIFREIRYVIPERWKKLRSSFIKIEANGD